MTLFAASSAARRTDDVFSFGWMGAGTASAASTEWAKTPGHHWDTASLQAA